MKTALVLVLATIVMVTTTATTAFAASKTNQISIRYVPPKNPAHQEVYTQLKQRRVLERLQIFLSPFRLPGTLRISLTGCDGEPDAWYEDDDITICYEFVDDLWQNMPEETTPSGIAPIDTVIGPLFEASLHEFSHAIFDLLELPIFGREETAADMVAAYIILQLEKPEARRLIAGTVHAYSREEKLTGGSRSLEDFSNEHDTPAQRAYNLMCMAFGADAKLFGDFVSKGYLPKERAEFCEDEYFQIQDAYKNTVDPYLDLDLAKKILDRKWACELDDDAAPGGWQNCVPVPLK